MATHPSWTTIDGETPRLNGGLFTDTSPRAAQSAPPPAADPPRRTRAQAIRMQRRAFGQRGTLAAFGAAVTVVAGTFTALQLPGPARSNAPDAAESLPVELSPAGIETPTLAVAAAVLAGAAPLKEASPLDPSTPAIAPSAATGAAPRPTGEAKALAPTLEALPFFPPTLNGDHAGREINTAAASTALSVAASRARSCIETDDPRTTMEVRVTFAPSGRVTTAMVSRGPFAGTEVGGCIARALRSAKVGPFEGPPVTVSRSIRIR
jgi:hypothetical protein